MDYRYFRPDRAWIIRESIKIAVFGCVTGYLFFRKIIAVLFVMPFGILIWKKDISVLKEKRKKRFAKEFRDMLTALSGNLNAGYSLEKAIYKTYGDLMKSGITYLYMTDELKLLIHGIECNKRVEELIADMAVRSDAEDIKDFSEFIRASKIYGGNMVAIIRQTVNNLNEKYMVEDEIETIISAKKLEGKIMLAMPFLIILYMNFTNKSYMSVIYETTMGNVVMAAGLLLIMAASAAINKIVEIEV